MKKNKTIFHIDFDSYFCNAHRALNSDLKNKPIAVGKKEKRSIACSLSYELKNKGAKIGWPNYKVLEIEPKTIFINPNFDLYTSLSNKIFEYLSEKYSKKIQVFSIDECWIDVSDIVEKQNSFKLAEKMQKEILKKYSIPISIGISHNKFLAKMGTNLAKPFGIKIVNKEILHNEIWPKNLIEYFGIGAPTTKKLNKIGIETIGQLATTNPNNAQLIDIFRSKTKQVIDEANGISDDEIIYEKNEPKSIGHDLTFLSFDLNDANDIYDVLYNMTKRICKRAYNRNLIGNIITLSIRNTKRKWSSKQNKIKNYTNNIEEVYKIVTKLFDQSWNGEYIRGLGVKISNLKNEFSISKPISLFEPIEQKNNKIKNIIRDTNKKMKNKILHTGDEFERNKTKDKIQIKYVEEDFKK